MNSRALENGTPEGVAGADAPIVPLLRLDEVSAILRRSMCALRGDIKAGRIRCVRLGGRILIEESECRRVIEAARQ